jgi:hypothetical protein
MARACVFCGGVPLTREHVFPRWLDRVLPAQEHWRGQDLAEVGGELLTAPMLPTTNRQMGEKFTETTVTRVCKACNNGWMHALEEMARPLLTALIGGRRAEVAQDDAGQLALWVAKTCLMAQFTHPESAAVLPRQYQWLYERQTPPPRIHIWALSVEARDWALRMQHFGILYGDPDECDPSEPCNTYSTTIGLGQVAFCVMGTTSESMILPDLEDVTPLDAVRLWPDPRPFEWGRATPLGDEDLWFVSDYLRLWIGEDDDPFLDALMKLGIRRGRVSGLE